MSPGASAALLVGGVVGMVVTGCIAVIEWRQRRSTRAVLGIEQAEDETRRYLASVQNCERYPHESAADFRRRLDLRYAEWLADELVAARADAAIAKARGAEIHAAIEDQTREAAGQKYVAWIARREMDAVNRRLRLHVIEGGRR